MFLAKLFIRISFNVVNELEEYLYPYMPYIILSKA